MPEDAAAVERVRAGDRDAFALLVERHSASIFRLAYRMMGNETDAEEVVQETFMRAYRALDGFELRSSFATWLYRIATNCALDMAAKRRPTQPLVMENDEGEMVEMEIAAGNPSPERQVIGTEVRRKLAGAMQYLTPIERTAFVLRHFEGRSIDEIRKVLKLSEGSTKNAVFRAVQKLRRALAPFAGQPL